MTNAFNYLVPSDKKIAIIVPSTYDVNVPMDNKLFVKQTMEEFTIAFGGATSVKQDGTYMTDYGEIVTEQVTMVYAFTDTLSDTTLNYFYEFAQRLGLRMKQESIGVEVNGSLYFVRS